MLVLCLSYVYTLYMRPISRRVRRFIDTDPEYKDCMLRAHPDHECGGRITMEHALIYAGRQIDEPWAIISVCAKGQEVDEFQDAHTMDKNLNKWVALNRATDEDFRKYPKGDFLWQRDFLNSKYGEYEPAPVRNLTINYPF